MIIPDKKQTTMVYKKPKKGTPIYKKCLIQNIIKPDYNHWEGKEEFEERFMTIIQGGFK